MFAFSDARKFDDAQESLSVEVVSADALNRMAKGEKTAPPAPKPAQHADKAAQEVKTPPHPTQDARRDVEAPAPQLKRLKEPSDDEAEDKPAKEALPPPPPPRRLAALPEDQPKEKPAPTPPPRPRIQPPTKAKAAPPPEKDEPEEAEVVKPKPPQKPKLEQVEKEAPTPPEKPKERVKDQTKEVVKEPPKRPPEPKAAEPKQRLKVDEVAKLLSEKKSEKTAKEGADGANEKADKSAKAAKPKSGDETAPKSRFSAASIATLLSHEAPHHSATGPKTQLASLGAPTGAAPKMSASLEGRIDALLIDHYQQCWRDRTLTMNVRTYVPQVELHISRAGALEQAPRLLNPSSNPTERAYAEQALAALRGCPPLRIPAEFLAYYDYWRVKELNMLSDR